MNGSGYERAEVAQFYEHVVPYTERADVDFYIEAATQSGGPVLELGCGTGRVLIPTARAGIDITGLDVSEPMLGICRDRLAKEPDDVRSRVELVRGRMEDFGLDRKFRLVTLPFRPFQLLTIVEAQMACLRCAAAHLEDAGALILDVFNPDIRRLALEDLEKESEHEPEFTMPDGRKVVRCYRPVSRDLFNQVTHGELIYDVTHPNGRTERVVDSFRMRYLFRFEAEHLLARCGFETETVYADYDKSPYGSKYPGELIIVARKV